MAEAEDVLIDAARHTTVFAQRLWRRYRRPPEAPLTVMLIDVAERLDLLLSAVFATHYRIRIAQPPARPTLLDQLLHRQDRPRRRVAIPATNGTSLWLPHDSHITDPAIGNELYRVMAVQQAVRAARGSALHIKRHVPLEVADLYLLLEAQAADVELVELLPGMSKSLDRLRQHALAARPPLAAFAPRRLPIESFLRELLGSSCTALPDNLPYRQSPGDSLDRAYTLAAMLGLEPPRNREILVKDWWTGEFRAADRPGVVSTNADKQAAEESEENIRSAHIQRRPEVREAVEGEDDEQSAGPWMVQVDEPHPHAEDPLGLNRPTDRDEDTSADQYGEMVSELPAARLVATPSRPKEVLISDDPPDVRAAMQAKETAHGADGLSYPEWDHQHSRYRIPGATVRILDAEHGSQKWVESILGSHQAMLNLIRRRFEMLQAQRVWQRRRVDGDEVDLDAYVDSYASFRAGQSLSDTLYQSRRKLHRNMAITLLIDVSGSTDSWISSHRRVIDVEREALLLVGIALQSLGEPYSIEAFSGEGPDAVTVRQIKRFDEPFSNDVALRISALEPEHYTRAGAAIRHACAGLMQQPAAHRLLLLLSDGKPSDKDQYEGQYGVEDMRQAVTEATLQGISPFCLTIDRQASSYLPHVFGPTQYALLPQPQLLPVVLLDWMRRLLTW